MELAVAPEREGVAVCVDEVGEGLQLTPLRPVVGVPESVRVGSLAGL